MLQGQGLQQCRTLKYRHGIEAMRDPKSSADMDRYGLTKEIGKWSTPVNRVG